MEVFNKQQLIVIHVFGLCLVAVATVLLPYLTAGNFIVFTLLRFPGFELAKLLIGDVFCRQKL